MTLNRAWRWLLILLVALLSACGGGMGSQTEAAMAPGSYAPDRDADGIADESDSVAAAEAAPMPAPGPPPPAEQMAQAGGLPGQPAREPAGGETTPTTKTGSAPNATDATKAPAEIASPLLIYKARVNLAVFEVKAALEKTEKSARDIGGYLVRRDDHSITVRVPAQKFQATLDAYTKLGDVLHREVEVQDVTAEFRDVEIRLKNAEAVRTRLQALLDRAASVKDALEVERELGRVTEEIERFKGRLKLLKELIAFSTITLEFQPRATDHIDTTVELPFPWLKQLGLSRLLRL